MQSVVLLWQKNVKGWEWTAWLPWHPSFRRLASNAVRVWTHAPSLRSDLCSLLMILLHHHKNLSQRKNFRSDLEWSLHVCLSAGQANWIISHLIWNECEDDVQASLVFCVCHAAFLSLDVSIISFGSCFWSFNEKEAALILFSVIFLQTSPESFNWLHLYIVIMSQ